MDDVDISLRLKYGKHTVFMFVDPLAPFSRITDELLKVLRERHPDGLHASRMSDVSMRLPADDEEVTVSYAILKTPSDPSQGWKDLRITGNEAPVDKGIKNNATLAFVIHDSDDPDSNPRFIVEWPSLDDELPE